MSKHFKLEEFACSTSGLSLMNEQLLQALEEIRERLGEPMIITSGYRSDQHPITQSKIDKGAKHGGAHHLGYAADVGCAGPSAMKILALAIENPAITGVGVKQSGPWNSRFIHLDAVPQENNFGLTRPALWSY
jgi:zinc D-Ala-D-Ala carboxypeptidase